MASSNKSKDKGTRAENALKKLLKEKTGLGWERTPLSGALDAKHMLKGDLYIPGVKNKYCIEVKHYADSAITHLLLSGKNPTLVGWWEQCDREAEENKAIPLLIFKHDRSKWYMAVEDCKLQHKYMTLNTGEYVLDICMLEHWLEVIEPEFIE